MTPYEGDTLKTQDLTSEERCRSNLGTIFIRFGEETCSTSVDEDGETITQLCIPIAITLDDAAFKTLMPYAGISLPSRIGDIHTPEKGDLTAGPDSTFPAAPLQ